MHKSRGRKGGREDGGREGRGNRERRRWIRMKGERERRNGAMGFARVFIYQYPTMTRLR